MRKPILGLLAALLSGTALAVGVTQGSRDLGYVLNTSVWASRPTCNAAASGNLLRVTDIGQSGVGVLMICNGTYWKLTSSVTLFADNTLATAPNLNTSVQILKNYSIPAGLIRAGTHLIVRAIYGKDGTTDTTTVKGYIGTVGNGTDPGYLSSATMTTTNIEQATETWFQINGATSMRLVSDIQAISGFTGSVRTIAPPQTYTGMSDLDANPLIISLGTQMSGSTNHGTVISAIVQLVP